MKTKRVKRTKYIPYPALSMLMNYLTKDSEILLLTARLAHAKANNTPDTDIASLTDELTKAKTSYSEIRSSMKAWKRGKR